ncbi:hypothetical protein INT45_013282, partial [Circinella minor]
MSQQIADDEEANITDVEGGEEVESEEKCIWSEWKDFLNNPNNTAHLIQLSPEKHGVIWCGNLVRRRSCYPAELYKKTNEEVTSVERKSIDSHFIEAINDVADATSSQDMEDAVERLNCIEVDDKLVAEKKFTIDIGACAETVETMGLLRAEHVSALRKNIKTGNLTSIVNPVIIRLNVGKHMAAFTEEGLMRIPGSSKSSPFLIT